jgi:hypothetical protein
VHRERVLDPNVSARQPEGPSYGLQMNLATPLMHMVTRQLSCRRYALADQRDRQRSTGPTLPHAGSWPDSMTAIVHYVLHIVWHY